MIVSPMHAWAVVFLKVVARILAKDRSRPACGRAWLSLLVQGIALFCFAPVGWGAESSSCAGCHQEQYQQWQQSHHAKAMQVASEATVLARFDGTETVFGEHTFRFFKRDRRFQVSIQKSSSDSAPQLFDIPYTFGVSPLQQYLAQLPKGKLQALPVAWDARPKAEGGQRWYALESDLEWDHPGFTWNTSCADCHSTGLKKNYDALSQQFDTQWDEINVSCASCHGNADGHRRWLQDGKPESQPHSGFGATLAERGQWQWLDNATIAQRMQQPKGEQLSTCGQCHSRRDRIGEWHPGTALLDHSAPASVSPPLYFADGQIRDEVFVLGSFMQSRMHAAGVVCSNCHEPHSLTLRAEGDGLCGQCHRETVFSTPDHHGHKAADVQCVDCHMPATVYMGVDARRDHRLGIPDPLLSGELGSPDPCSSCHEGKTPENLAAAIRSWRAQGKQPPPSLVLTRLFAEAESGVISNALRYRLDGDVFPPLRQAAILLASEVNADAAMLAIVAGKLRHTDPLVRVAAVRRLADLPLPQRWEMLSPLVNDPLRAVRFEVASQLAGAHMLSLSPAERAGLETLFQRYEGYLQLHQDSPTLVSNLGNFYMTQDRLESAEGSYRRALELDDKFIYPYMQLAELARTRNASQVPPARSEKDWLDAALQVAPNEAELHYRYGLFQVRARDYPAALAALARSHRLAPTAERYATTYAIALENTGDASTAIAILAAFYQGNPQASASADLLVRYSLKGGDRKAALGYVQQWLAQEPDNPQAQQWHQYLQRSRQ